LRRGGISSCALSARVPGDYPGAAHASPAHCTPQPATIATFRNPANLQPKEPAMGEQRREKMTKKPKKDTSPPKTGSTSDRPQAPVTVTLPKGKEKKR
jgi:hypothetical protein